MINLANVFASTSRIHHLYQPAKHFSSKNRFIAFLKKKRCFTNITGKCVSVSEIYKQNSILSEKLIGEDSDFERIKALINGICAPSYQPD